MNQCSVCGSTLEEGRAFCPNCGTAVNTTAPQEAPTEAPYAAPVENEAPVNQPATPPYAAPGTPVVNGIPQPVKPDNTPVITIILGAIGLAFNTILNCLCGCLGSFPGFICAVIGLVLGIMAMKKVPAGQKADSKLIIGLVLCGVALGLGILVAIINGVLGATLYSEFMYY